MRQNIVPRVQAGLDEALGGDALDLRKLFVKAAPPEIARATGLDETAIRTALREGLDQARLNGDISPAGVAAIVSVNGMLPGKASAKPSGKPKGTSLTDATKFVARGRITNWRTLNAMTLVTDEGKTYNVMLTPQTTYKKAFTNTKPQRIEPYTPQVRELSTFERKSRVAVVLDRDDPQRERQLAC